MLIKSQDECLIVNMQSVSKIRITGKSSNGEVSIKAYTGDKTISYIGNYKSKERAEEVLKEICETYQKCCDYDYVTIRFPKQNVYIRPNYIFQMPKE